MSRVLTARLFQASCDAKDLRAAILNLSAMGSQERTVSRPVDRRVYSLTDVDADGLGLWTLRREVDIHQNGVIMPWDLDADMAEGSFFRFFDDGLTVMLAVGHGPRTSALGSYLKELCDVDAIFDPIVRHDRETYVVSLDDVRRIELTLVGHEIVRELREIDESLGEAAAALVRASSADKLKITFDGTDHDSRDTMWGRTSGPEGWLRSLMEHLPVPGLVRLHVVTKGEISGEEEIDVLKDKITYQVQVDSPRLSLENAMGVAALAYDRYRNEPGQ